LVSRDVRENGGDSTEPKVDDTHGKIGHVNQAAAARHSSSERKQSDGSATIQNQKRP
jgi:hypothetical protein